MHVLGTSEFSRRWIFLAMVSLPTPDRPLIKTTAVGCCCILSLAEPIDVDMVTIGLQYERNCSEYVPVERWKQIETEMSSAFMCNTSVL